MGDIDSLKGQYRAMQAISVRALALLFAGWLVACTSCGAQQRTGGGAGLLPMGKQVAALSAVDQRGQVVRLAPPLSGHVVVYFYPKDGTPGCTAEACAFRDVWAEYERAGVVVIGVSSDSVDSHRDFAKKEALPFSLVADADGTWARAFGVSAFAGFYSRVTFVLSPTGKVVRLYEDVDPGLHAKQILADIAALPSTQ